MHADNQWLPEVLHTVRVRFSVDVDGQLH